jgi:NADPH-ferrihemoprotein reductase
VLPENDSSVVEALARSQGYELDAVFEISAAKAPFPTPCSVREALTRYLDLKGIPRRSTLSQLASFAQDAAQRERLQRLASKAGREEYQEFVCKGGRSLADLITSSFPSLSIPLEHFVALAPHLQPRYYTISSSSSVHPSRIHVTVAVTEDRLADGRVHKGVCSTYLAGLKEGAAVRVFVRPSTFRLPADPSTPVIMVGPGTGIAPMRAMLQERKHQRVVEGRAVGASHLFFGCRRRDTDFLYQDELTAYEADGTLAKLHLAFSREAASKVYVQHVMAKPEAAALLWRLLKDEGAHVYVCGATTMGHDVHTAFVDIAVSQGKQSQEQAAAWVKGLQDRSRYVCELW